MCLESRIVGHVSLVQPRLNLVEQHHMLDVFRRLDGGLRHACAILRHTPERRLPDAGVDATCGRRRAVMRRLDVIGADFIGHRTRSTL